MSALSTNARARIAAATVALLLPVLAAAGAAAEPGQTAPPDSRAALVSAWGVEVLGIHTSAAGYLLDFRYRVVDPVKAAPILDRSVKPFVVAESSGLHLGVPSPPKVGSLRNTGRPEAGRSYFVLFGNPGKLVKPGELVTVVVGDFKVENLKVE
jgi:hypothetical protein